MKAYLINLDTMRAVGRFASTNDAERVGDKAAYSFDVIEAEGDDLKRYKGKELVVLYNAHRGNHVEVKKFSDSATARKRVIQALDIDVADKAEKMIKEKKERGETYGDKLRRLFPKGGDKHIPKGELAKALDTTEKNASVSVAIIRNPGRTKDPLNIQYDRKSKEYYLAC